MRIESLIYEYAKNGELLRLELLNYYPKDQVKLLIHSKVEGTTPLLIACLNGHFSIVDFLVRVHSCDIEQIGSISFENETIEGAPPLWAAAAAGRGNIVAYLIGCGAKVNHTTRSNSTPLRAACFDGHIVIVEYLIRRGADTEIANYHGHTCLMIACYQNKIKIVELLIKAGVDVNRRSEKGNTALHDCSEAGNLNIFKLLLKHNAKMERDEFNVTPLITAASSGNLSILEYMVKNCQCISEKDVINALMLLGSTFVDKDRDILKGKKYWMLALMKKWRLKIAGTLYEEEMLEPLDAYDNIREMETPEELNEKSSSIDWIYMQALIIRERILGPINSDTSYYIRHRGAVYADNGDFERCMKLWNHAIHLQLENRSPLSLLTQTSFLSFAELFFYLRMDDKHWRYHSISVKDMVKVLGLSVFELERSGPHLTEYAKQEIDCCYKCNCGLCHLRSQCDQLMLVMLHIASLVYSFIENASNHQSTVGNNNDADVKGQDSIIDEFKKLVYRMVRVPVNGTSAKTFLHLACTKSSSVIGRFPLSVQTCVSLCQLFVEVGSDVNAKDAMKRTPLHVALCCKTAETDDIAIMLMDHGAHVDIQDIKGVTPYKMLYNKGRRKANKENMSLQCMAAVAVSKYYDVKNIGLTTWMVEFVEMH